MKMSKEVFKSAIIVAILAITIIAGVAGETLSNIFRVGTDEWNETGLHIGGSTRNGSGTYYLNGASYGNGTADLAGGTLNNLIITNASISAIDPWVDVRSLGVASGDNVSDAIQSYLNINTQNYTLFFPCGTYFFNKEVNFSTSHKYITLRGNERDCVSLILQDGTDNSMFRIKGADYIHFVDLTLNGNNASNTATNPLIMSTSFNGNYLSFDNLKFIDLPESAISLNVARGIDIKNCFFENIGGGSEFNGGVIEFYRVQRYVITNNVFNDYYGRGIYYFRNSGQALQFDGDDQGLISNNQFYGGHKDQGGAISLDRANGVTISDNIIDGQFDSANGVNGIYTYLGSEISIINNRISNQTGSGIESHSNHTTIIGNIVKDTRYEGTQNSSSVWLSGMKNVIFKGNILSKSSKHGLVLESPMDAVIIEGNIIENPCGGGSDDAGIRMMFSSASNNIDIKNNIIRKDDSTCTMPYGINCPGCPANARNMSIMNNIILGASTKEINGPTIDVYRKSVVGDRMYFGDGSFQQNLTLTSPDTSEWCCGVDDSGTFACSTGGC